jgi:2-succinyl-5-enolpyruvyl-6-hydroxy-3-cyclohexene-1-carboxylate synthase
MQGIQKQARADLNLLWASLIIEELSRLGVEHVCMAPGSRSTPLTLACAANNKLTKHCHFDERGLGFMALGLAKASNTPVAIITTSGTAVANLYPAIIEASLTRVPLIILSADRPPELLDCGANQAITQVGIFAHYAKQLSLPVPDLHLTPTALLSSLDQALADTQNIVHINCPFREPLYPDALLNLADFFSTDNLALSQYLAPLSNWVNTKKSYVSFHTYLGSTLPSTDTMMRFVHGKGVILVGALAVHEDCAGIIALAQKIGWPILCDAQSQLRQHPSVLGHGDQLLLQPKTKRLLEQADRVLVFGGRFVSKRFIALLKEHAWHSYWQVLPQVQQLDPSHSPKQVWHASVKACCELAWPRSSSANWAVNLIELNQHLEDIFTAHVDNSSLGEAQIIRAIAKAQTASSQLFIGNSLPIRLYDMYAPITTQAIDIYTNRGASGIDGIIATACGIASSAANSTTLVIGDISALHDLNSLALASQLKSNLVIVILNNDGGSVFNLLPVPNAALKNDFYRLPHGYQFGYGAAMFGLAYNQADSLDEFNELYQDALAYAGTSIIEVCIATDQASNQISLLNQWVRQD